MGLFLKPTGLRLIAFCVIKSIVTENTNYMSLILLMPEEYRRVVLYLAWTRKPNYGKEHASHWLLLVTEEVIS